MEKKLDKKAKEELKKKEFIENKAAVVEAGKKMEKEMGREAKHTTKVKSPEQERREEKYLAY